MKLLDRILYVIDSISLWSGRIIAAEIVIMVLMVCYTVFMRYLFRAPPIWGFDLGKLLLLTAGCIAGAYATFSRSHIRIEVLYKRWSPRRRALVDAVLYDSALILTAIVVVWFGWGSTWYAIKTNASVSGLWPAPLWLYHIMIPIAGVLIGLQAIANLIRDLHILVTGKEREGRFLKGTGGIMSER